jgi:hypothetical protein
MTSKNDSARCWQTAMCIFGAFGFAAYLALALAAFGYARDEHGNFDIGKFGDAFGVATSIVTALGFIGIIFNIQQSNKQLEHVERQVALQQRELLQSQHSHQRTEFNQIMANQLSYFYNASSAFSSDQSTSIEKHLDKIFCDVAATTYADHYESTEDLHLQMYLTYNDANPSSRLIQVDNILASCIYLVKHSPLTDKEKNEYFKMFLIPQLGKNHLRYLAIESRLQDIQYEYSFIDQKTPQRLTHFFIITSLYREYSPSDQDSSVDLGNEIFIINGYQESLRRQYKSTERQQPTKE